MLAIVQNDEHPAGAQIIEYGGETVIGIAPNSECSHQSNRNKSRIVDGGEIHKANAIDTGFGIGVRSGNGHGRLAYAARAHQRHMAFAVQCSQHLAKLCFPTHNLALGRQMAELGILRIGVGHVKRADPRLYRRDEPIASAHHRREIAGIEFGVPKQLPQVRHVDLEIALMDKDARPGGGLQFFFADELVAALHEQPQQLEGPTSEIDRPVPVKEELAARNQPVWPEGEYKLAFRALSSFVHEVAPRNRIGSIIRFVDLDEIAKISAGDGYLNPGTDTEFPPIKFVIQPRHFANV